MYVLIAIGLGITGYLSYSSLFGNNVCSTEGCSTVLASAYSELLGIPVAFLGFLTYAVILYYHAIRDEKIIPWLLLLGIFAVGYFNWGMYKIDAFCVWCESSHLTLTLLYFTSGGITRKSVGYFFLALLLGIIASETFLLVT